MEALFNLSAGVYEAIILATLAVAVYAVFALRSKAKKYDVLKASAVKLAEVGSKTILGLSFALMGETAKRKRAERAAAEAEQALMETRADIDDTFDDARSEGRPNLDRLFSLLDPRWQGRVNPIDALLFGGHGPDRYPTVRGRPFDLDLLDDGPGSPFARGGLIDSLREPGRGGVKAFAIGRDGKLTPVGGTIGRDPGFPFSAADLTAALHGDTSGIERALGAPPGSVHLEVLDGRNGRELTGGDRAAAIADITGGPRFDIDQASVDGVDEARRHFGPDSGGDPLSAHLRGGKDPYEAIAEHTKASLTPAEPVDSANWTGHGPDGQAPVLDAADEPTKPNGSYGYGNPRAG